MGRESTTPVARQRRLYATIHLLATYGPRQGLAIAQERGLWPLDAEEMDRAPEYFGAIA